MSKKNNNDHAFEIAFYESYLARDPDSVDALENLAHLYTKNGRIADGLAADRRLVGLTPQSALAHYNLACSLALSRQGAAALESLQQAVALGYDDHAWMKKDPDLESLRDDPEFQTLLSILSEK